MTLETLDIERLSIEYWTVEQHREYLYKSMRRWKYPRYNPLGRLWGEQGRGSRRSWDPMTWEDMGEFTYQTRWREFSPELPINQRFATELELINHWGIEEVAKMLGVQPDSIRRYRNSALNTVARQIHSLQKKYMYQCLRPGCEGTLWSAGAVIFDPTEVVCSLCARNLVQMMEELGG